MSICNQYYQLMLSHVSASPVGTQGHSQPLSVNSVHCYIKKQRVNAPRLNETFSFFSTQLLKWCHVVNDHILQMQYAFPYSLQCWKGGVMDLKDGFGPYLNYNALD